MGNIWFTQRTIDGNSHALSENIAVGADKGRDLGELVVLEVLWVGLAGVCLDCSEVEVVGLRNSQDGCRARVGLDDEIVSAEVFRLTDNFHGQCSSLPGMCRAFRTTCLDSLESGLSELMKEQNRVCRKLFSTQLGGKMVGHAAGFTLKLYRWLESSSFGTKYLRPRDSKVHGVNPLPTTRHSSTDVQSQYQPAFGMSR